MTTTPHRVIRRLDRVKPWVTGETPLALVIDQMRTEAMRHEPPSKIAPAADLGSRGDCRGLCALDPRPPGPVACQLLGRGGAAPYRPIYTWLVAGWFSRRDVYYWRIGDVFLLRVLPFFDGDEIFDRGDVILNAGKIAIYLEDDYTVDGVLYPKPPAVADVERTMEPGSERYAVEICKAAIKPSPLDPPLP